MFDRRRHAVVPAHRPETHVQVEELAKRDVQRTDAAADWRRERPLDAHQVMAKRFDSFVRQPGFELLEALLPGVDLEPLDLLLATVGLLHGGIEDADAGAPNISSRTITFDERNDRIVRYDETAVLDGDGCPGGRRFEHRKSRHGRIRSHHQRDVTGSSQNLWKTLLKSSPIQLKAPREFSDSSGLHHRSARRSFRARTKNGTLYLNASSLLSFPVSFSHAHRNRRSVAIVCS
jgi:hypothetical protein